MNELQIFNNPKFGNVRTVEHEGEVWFSGNDVARALGYGDGNPNSKALAHAVQDHVSEDDKRLLKRSDFKVTKTAYLDGISNYGAVFINESGVYSLIFGSKLESAKEFKRWVTHDVLPSIRKTGKYQSDGANSTFDNIKLLAQGYVEVNARVEKIESTVSKMKDELPLFPVELEVIVKAVKKRGMDIVGGKENPAYSMVYRKVVSDIYSELHRNFNVDSYKNIRRHDLSRVRDVVAQYRPPMFLADMIEEANEGGAA